MIENSWQFIRKEDGTCAIVHNDKLLCDSIAEKWLGSEFARYGFCGQEYRDIRTQLDVSSRCELNL